VRPGITGWAQVNGRNALSWEEKFEHDVWYVDNRSFWLDIRVLWRKNGSDTLRMAMPHGRWRWNQSGINGWQLDTRVIQWREMDCMSL
jgi:hypothetical protein